MDWHTQGVRTVAVVLLTVAGLLASTPATAASARLRIVDRSPLVLNGSGFGKLERVTVTVTLGKKTERRILRTTRAGGFVARFPDLTYDRCHGALKVSAVGARGHRTAFSIQPLPCPDSGGDTQTS